MIQVLGLSDCRPCKTLVGMLETIGVDYRYVDLEKFPELAEEFQVSSVPVILFPNGSRFVGSPPLQQLQGLIEVNRI